MKKIIFSTFIFTLLISLLFIGTPLAIKAQSEDNLPTAEEIHNYESLIILKEDGTLEVTENIVVTALGLEIKRGIYRDFPTNYRSQNGFAVNTTFDVNEVLKDGIPEPYFTERQINGVRLYIGSENVYLPYGDYKYTISYRSKNQISYNEENDRLLYNITGSGWTFPILKSSAKVVLPQIVDHEAITAEGFAGETGSVDNSNVIVDIQDVNGRTEILYTNQSIVTPGTDFTIDLKLPKGILSEPEGITLILTMIKDNFSIFLFILSSIMIFAISIYMWFKKGRDPNSKSVFPQFQIPTEISPGTARYIMRMGYDNTILTSIIASLGSKGYLKLEENKGKGLIKKKKTYTITRLFESKENLTNDEEKFIEDFFKNDRNSITFGDTYSAHIETAATTFRNFYDSDIKSKYFSNNLKYSTPIIVLAILNFVIFASLQYFMYRYVDLITTIVVIGWGIIVSVIGFLLYNKYQSKIRVGLFSGFALLTLIFVLFVFVTFTSIGLFNLLLIIPASVITSFTIIFSYFGLKARTVEGKEIENQLLGLKMFINAAEDEKIKIVNNSFPKDMNTFNKYFPYALAFGLELKWAEQFKDVIKAAQLDPSSNQGYNLGWYYGIGSFNSNSFSSSMSDNLVTSIASSATPPSSSGSGGGFSGGGGGGGGGGGW